MVISIRELQKVQAEQEAEAHRQQAMNQRYPQREWGANTEQKPKGALKIARFLYES